MPLLGAIDGIMSFAIDLNTRQSARTLAQAIRHQAEVVLTPRVEAGPTWIGGRLLREDQPSSKPAHAVGLRIQITQVGEPFEPEPDEPAPPMPTVEDWPGLYCDAVLRLGEHQYMFCADVLRLEPRDTPPGVGSIVTLTRPTRIQVAQRRRFCRFEPAKSSQIELRWLREDATDGVGVAWLCNISADGLACRTEQRIADQLLIGTELRLEFRLATTDARALAIDAMLINKLPAGTESRSILGLQFLTGPDHLSSTAAIRDLRRLLQTRGYARASVSEGADP